MTLDHLDRMIRARIVVLDSLVEKADWVGVKETAEELIQLERQVMLIEAKAKAELDRPAKKWDD